MIREVPHGARWQAAATAAEWGYPRPISGWEVECGDWFAGVDRLCWFVPLEKHAWAWWAPGCEPPRPGDVLAVHGIASKAAQRAGRVLTQRTVIVLETLAQLLGATRLYSLIPREMADSAMPIDTMRRYLRRLGWEEDDIGYYRQLA